MVQFHAPPHYRGVSLQDELFYGLAPIFEPLHERIPGSHEGRDRLALPLPGSLCSLKLELESYVLPLRRQLLVQLHIPPMVSELSCGVVPRQLYLKEISLSSYGLDDGVGGNCCTH